MLGFVLVVVLTLALVLLRFSGPATVPGGEHLLDYFPEGTTGVIECDLPRLSDLETVLPGFASKWREALIPAVGFPPLGRVRCLIDPDGALTLSRSSEVSTHLPVVSSRDLFTIGVGDRQLFLLEAPPYRITSTNPQRVFQARDFARQADRRARNGEEPSPPWPDWVKKPPEGNVPVWLCIRLDRCTLPKLPTDHLREEMSGLLTNAASNVGLLKGWMRVSETEIEVHLEVQPRSPEQAQDLRNQIQQIQERAVDYDDADVARRTVWSPLGKLLRTVKPEVRERSILLHRVIPREPPQR
jgi:hypothetical protein